MNRRQKISGAKRGSALLAALCFAAVLGIALASYMGVCSQTLQLSNRNSQGTRSLELAETGMEDALWALNKGDWTGWTVDNGSSPHLATKTLGGFAFGNGVTGTAVITIENYDGASALPEYAQDLRKLKVTGQTTLGDGTTVTRKFQASAQPAPLFVNAVAAVSNSGDGSSNGRTGVTFTNAGSVDSFDSVRTGIYGDLDGDGIANGDDDDMDGDGIPNADDDDDDGDGIPDEFDTNLYGSAFGFSAVVSSASSVTLTGTQVSGYVSAAASQTGDARLSYSAGARLAGPNTSMSTMIDASRISSSPYQPVFEIKTPTGTSSTFPTLPNTTSSASIGDSSGATTFYSAGDVTLSGSQVLTVNGPVVLVVSGNFKIQDNAEIIVTNLTNASGEIIGASSLQVILTGSASELSIGGKGIRNETKRPKNVAIFDGASSPYNGPEITTTSDFYGVVYAPNSDRELTVSSDSLHFYGSLVAKNVTITGSAEIHYDVDLRRVTTKFTGIDTPFVISAWQETTPLSAVGLRRLTPAAGNPASFQVSHRIPLASISIFKRKERSGVLINFTEHCVQLARLMNLDERPATIDRFTELALDDDPSILAWFNDAFPNRAAGYLPAYCGFHPVERIISREAVNLRRLNDHTYLQGLVCDYAKIESAAGWQAHTSSASTRNSRAARTR